jgi:hypothetical protein
MVLTLVFLLIYCPYRLLKQYVFDASQQYEFIIKMHETSKLNIKN